MRQKSSSGDNALQLFRCLVIIRKQTTTEWHALGVASEIAAARSIQRTMEMSLAVKGAT